MNKYLQGTDEYKAAILRGAIAYIQKQLPEAIVFDDNDESVSIEYVKHVRIDQDVERIVCQSDEWWDKFISPIVPALQRNKIQCSYWGDESGFIFGVLFYK